jgi:hypothetical protein
MILTKAKLIKMVLIAIARNVEKVIVRDIESLNLSATTIVLIVLCLIATTIISQQKKK